MTRLGRLSLWQDKVSNYHDGAADRLWYIGAIAHTRSRTMIAPFRAQPTMTMCVSTAHDASACLLSLWAIQRHAPIMLRRVWACNGALGGAFGSWELGNVRRHRRGGGGGNGVSNDWNQRPWQANERPPRNTSGLVVGIVCAAAVFLLSSTLLLALGAPQEVAAVFRPSTALVLPTSTSSQQQPDVTASDTPTSTTPNAKASPTATLQPGAPANPTAKPTGVATATRTPTRIPTATPTATPVPAPLLSLNSTSVDAVSCSSPSTTPVTVSNNGGGSMAWSSNSADGSANPPSDTLGAGGSEPVTITWNAPLTSGSTIQFTANGSVSSVTVTVTCSSS